MQTYEQLSDTKQLRRMRAEDKFLGKIERLEAQALPLIGQLCREGKTVYYINVLSAAGKMTGKTKESNNEIELINYLIRNKYVG